MEKGKYMFIDLQRCKDSAPKLLAPIRKFKISDGTFVIIAIAVIGFASIVFSVAITLMRMKGLN